MSVVSNVWTEKGREGKQNINLACGGWVTSVRGEIRGFSVTVF